MDHDLVLVNGNEIVRCEAVRETGQRWNGELLVLVNAIVGPWGMKRGTHTKVETMAIPAPTPELLSEVPPKSVMKFQKLRAEIERGEMIKQIKMLRMSASMQRITQKKTETLRLRMGRRALSKAGLRR